MKKQRFETVIDFEYARRRCVDAQDQVYICHWSDKKHITVWSLKDYRCVQDIPFPVKHICCGGFGGADLKDLYVATSRFWLPEDDPDFALGAGGIFHLRAEVAGLPEHFYKDQSLPYRK
jgi:sugar lactone lactonase YvrE